MSVNNFGHLYLVVVLYSMNVLDTQDSSFITISLVKKILFGFLNTLSKYVYDSWQLRGLNHLMMIISCFFNSNV